MHPRLLTTPYFTLHTFGLLLAGAYMAVYWWLIRAGRRDGLDEDALASLGLWAIVGAIIGAKALMIVRALPEDAANPADVFSVATLTSAGDFCGEFIGALVSSAIFFAACPNCRSGGSPTCAVPRSPSVRRSGESAASWRATTTAGRQLFLGRGLYGSRCGAPRRRPSWCAAPSGPAVRVADVPCSLSRARLARSPEAIRRRDHPRVHADVRDSAVLPGVLSRRRGPGLPARRTIVDLAVHRRHPCSRGDCAPDRAAASADAASSSRTSSSVVWAKSSYHSPRR